MGVTQYIWKELDLVGMHHGIYETQELGLKMRIDEERCPFILLNGLAILKAH